MVLQSEGATSRDRLSAVKEVLHRHVVYHQHIVQVHSDFVADDADLKRVPLAGWVIGCLQRLSRAVLVIMPLPKNLWVDFGQIKEFMLFLQFFTSFQGFEIWKSDF